MGTMMEVLDKIMSNIMGVTLGALFMFAGLFIQPASSITWMPNLMIFGGAFIVVMFLSTTLGIGRKISASMSIQLIPTSVA